MILTTLFSLLIITGFCVQVDAHALVEPPLGIQGTPARKDVKRPSPSAPCGDQVEIASLIESSNVITARADGTFIATALNFNAGKDGSRQFSAIVDPTGLGLTFVNVTILKNGDLEPKEVGPQDLTVALPPGTNCTGGDADSLCLVSFKSASGFGNCVLVRHTGVVLAATSTVAGATGTPIASSSSSKRVSGTPSPTTTNTTGSGKATAQTAVVSSSALPATTVRATLTSVQAASTTTGADARTTVFVTVHHFDNGCTAGPAAQPATVTTLPSSGAAKASATATQTGAPNLDPSSEDELSAALSFATAQPTATIAARRWERPLLKEFSASFRNSKRRLHGAY